MTLGSLFDGSGGFPLAGMMNGITHVWASDFERFPIKAIQICPICDTEREMQTDGNKAVCSCCGTVCEVEDGAKMDEVSE
jgi:hypothetical protein